MSDEGKGTLIDKSESSSFEDLASAAAHEIEEAKLAEAAAAAAEKDNTAEPKADEWQDLLGSGAILKKIIKTGDETSNLRPQRGDICKISYEVKIKDSDDLVEKRDQIKIYLGDNEIQDDTADLHGVSQPFISKICKKIAEAIAQLSYRFIKMPATLVEQEEKMQQFHRIANFPMVIGAIDCTHIRLKKINEEGGQMYINRKGYPSINVQVLQGLDLALTLMHKSEECLLQMAPRFAYGDAGLKPGESLGLIGEVDGAKYEGPVIGPDTILEARLELHDWSEEPEHETLSIAERMEIGIRRRARGNWWYGRGEAQLAVQLYRRALDVLDESEGGITDPTPSGDLAPTSDALTALLEERLRVHNNMAAAQLKAGAYEAALQAVTRVLTCQPNNAKALYRKSRILSAMGRNAEALSAARAAAAAAPGDAGARRELQRCEERACRDRSQERCLAKRMLGTAAPVNKPDKPDKDSKPSRAKMFVWGSLLLSLLVGVASVLVYRYKIQTQ